MKRILSVLAGLALTLTAGPTYPYYFFNDQPYRYTSGDCHPTLSDVDDWFWPVRMNLLLMGWNGTYWQNQSAWGVDFMDDRAEDADWADLAIFMGHGNVDKLPYSYSHDGICDAGNSSLTGETNIKMGASNHAHAAMTIFSACCFMSVRNPGAWVNTSSGNQLLGFGSTSWSDAGAVDNFWYSTGGSGNNEHAWLYEMEDKEGVWTGDNTTVVLTHGWNAADVRTNRGWCGLRRGTCWTAAGYPPGPPGVLAYIDHGCDSRCTGC